MLGPNPAVLRFKGQILEPESISPQEYQMSQEQVCRIKESEHAPLTLRDVRYGLRNTGEWQWHP